MKIERKKKEGEDEEAYHLQKLKEIKKKRMQITLCLLCMCRKMKLMNLAG